MIIKKAFQEIFPDRGFIYKSKITYSSRMKNYNSRANLQGRNLTFTMSKEWADVDDDIKIGLIQELLCKLFRCDRFTSRMEMYNLFIKKIALTVPKTETEPALESSFIRVNEEYFSGMLDQPNLRWGRDSLRTIGTYNYHSDTITISGVLRDEDLELLDYVMYHELLHKKLKYDHKVRNPRHHTKTFKQKEEEFQNHEMIEKRLERLLKKKRFPFF